jgi:hypothetical protein
MDVQKKADRLQNFAYYFQMVARVFYDLNFSDAHASITGKIYKHWINQLQVACTINIQRTYFTIVIDDLHCGLCNDPVTQLHNCAAIGVDLIARYTAIGTFMTITLKYKLWQHRSCRPGCVSQLIFVKKICVNSAITKAREIIRTRLK